MRLFVAIRLSDSMQKELVRLMHDMKQAGISGSYAAASNLHMTLCFIGETDKVQEVKAALKEVSFQPVRVTLTELGNFDKLLWVGAKSNQKLQMAARAVREAMEKTGIPYDKEKFVPHITIVRNSAGWKKQQFSLPKADMTASRISLMKSEQKNGKTVYTEIFGIDGK